jgi:16S rRNA (cytosine967-C5)-methyltransferase
LISPARVVAFDVLRRVGEGGYASDLLRAASGQLDSRDAGLAAEIVFGSLRYQKQLDYLIHQFARGRRLDDEVRIALRMGLYQLRHLERVPAHAAVSESVDLVKRARKVSAAGFVNSALRKITHEPMHWPDRATELSCPEWLLARWDREFGAATSDQIARAFLEPPEKFVASTGRVQDIGSQSIVPLLDLARGHTFLDVCAAPGNKTAQALEHGVEAIACDLHWHRLRALDDLGCRRVALDATQPLPFNRTFDRILVDAPCSGTGTLGRNPEIKWRLQPSDLADLQPRQIAILGNALALLSPGGILVYSTCSLEKEENDRVIARFPGPWNLVRRIPGQTPGDGFFAAVLNSKLLAND